jgi:hypothetical protein
VDGAFDLDVHYVPGQPLGLNILADVERATVMGQVLTNLHAPIALTDNGELVRISSLRADARDGVVSADVAAGVGERLDYETRIELVGVPLDGFARAPSETIVPAAATPDRPKPEGLVYASLSMSGLRALPDSRRGRGVVRVMHGKLAALPLTLQIMQVLQLTLPFTGGLDYADADMYLIGDRVVFERILFENSMGENAMLQLLGQGEMNFDTLELDLRFRPRSGVAGIRDIIGLIGDQLYEIELTGTLGEPMSRVIPLPK